MKHRRQGWTRRLAYFIDLETCEHGGDIGIGAGELEKVFEEILPYKDWLTSRDGGPRTIVREDMQE